MENSEKAPVENLTAEELVEMIDKICAEFEGQSDDLESAIGMLMFGRLYGWKVLYLVHSRRTVNKYAEILGIEDCKTFFRDRGPLARRSMAFKIADKLSNFWKAVKGEYDGKDTRTKQIG